MATGTRRERAVSDALSFALAKVATDEFLRLSQGASQHDAACAVESALRELAGLRRDVMPNYSNPWVVLCYALRYQASHVNLAYSTIRELLRARSGHAQVVDFGAGTLATQFGVALTLAESGPGVSAEVHSIDESREMMDLGARIWQAFSERVRDEDRQIYDACGRVTAVRASEQGVPLQANARRLLTVFHAAYGENSRDVAESLGALAERLDPHVCIVTAQESKAPLAARIAPVRVETARDVQPMFSGDLPKVTEVRKRIWSSIGRPSGIAARLLSMRVGWEWPESAILTFDRPS